MVSGVLFEAGDESNWLRRGIARGLDRGRGSDPAHPHDAHRRWAEACGVVSRLTNTMMKSVRPPSSFPRKRESRTSEIPWIPARPPLSRGLAGMTFAIFDEFKRHHTR